MDPFSVTAGVVGILAATLQVSAQLKQLIDGASTAGSAVAALLTEVEDFSSVIKLMQETFEDIPKDEQAIGHIGGHWRNIGTSIQDGQATIEKLKTMLEKVNKTVSMLDSTRKYRRLQSVSAEMGIYQQQIRSYKDTMYWSLQAIILWNQLHMKASTDKLLPNLDELQSSIRRIAHELTGRIESLHDFVRSKATDTETTNVEDLEQGLNNLQCCVQSAASVVSSASTILSKEQDSSSVMLSSDLGDCLPARPSTTMLRYLASNTVYEHSEIGEERPKSKPKLPNAESEEAQTSDESPYDSDEDIDLEMIRTLLQIGDEKLQAGELTEAERRFRRALAHSAGNNQASYRNLRLETITYLQRIYETQHNWTALETILLEKISWLNKFSKPSNEVVLLATMDLAKVLLHKQDHAQALLYCRRALKGFRKLGSPGVEPYKASVKLIIAIHHADGNDLEEEAWSSILRRTGSPVSHPNPLKVSEQDPAQGSVTAHDVPAAQLQPQVSVLVPDAEDEQLSKTQGTIDDSERLKAAFAGRAFLSELDKGAEGSHDPAQAGEETASGSLTTSKTKDGIRAPSDEKPSAVTRNMGHSDGTNNDSTSSQQVASDQLASEIAQHAIKEESKSTVASSGVVSPKNVVQTTDTTTSLSGNSDEPRAHDPPSPPLGPTSTPAPVNSASTETEQSLVKDVEEDTPNVIISKVEDATRATIQDESNVADDQTVVTTDESAQSAISAATTAVTKSVWNVSGTQDNTASKHAEAGAKAAQGMVKRRKLVVVGDGCSGKTYMLYTFVHGRWLGLYTTTPWDTYSRDIEVDGEDYELGMWDMAGQEDYDRLRPLAYPDTHIVIICFAIDSPDSLDNVQEKWISEVLHFCPGIPILLVGCKVDLRYDAKTIEELQKTREKPCTPEQGEEMRKKIGAIKYLECSALTGQGIQEVFEICARVTNVVARRKKKGWRKFFSR